MRVRILLLVASVLAALYLGFFAFEPVAAIGHVRDYGLWFIQAAFVIYLWALFRRLREVRSGWPEGLTRRRAILHGVIFMVCLGVLYAHEAIGFKIVMDEVNLLGTSMSMHYDRLACSPMRAYDLNGSFLLLGSFVDKRPLFYPYLVSLIHDLTGYRAANAFALNLVLLPLTLGAAYALVARLAGFRAAIAGLVLLATVPLFAQVAHGAGFELLNFFMIVVVALHAVDYLDRPDARRLTCLVYAGLLLAQVRYESVLFVVPIGLIVLLGFWRERRIDLPWPVLVAPLLLVVYPWIYNVLKLNPNSWQLQDIQDAEHIFSWQYIPDNLGYLLNFLYETDGSQPGSMVLATVGLLGLLFYLVRELRRLPEHLKRPDARTGFLVMVLAVSGLTLFLLMYFWGRFTDPVVRRLSLPIFFVLALPLPVICAEQKHAGRWLGSILAVALLGLYAQTIPTVARNVITQEYLPAREMNWKVEFLESLPEGNYLFIDNPGVWITHGQSAVAYGDAMKRKRELKFNLMNKTFDRVYVLQRQGKWLDRGKLVGLDPQKLDEDLVLEPVTDKSFNGIAKVAVYRLNDVKGDFVFEEEEYGTNPLEIEENVREVRVLKAKEQLAKWARMLP